jgi:hypothetical protein
MLTWQMDFHETGLQVSLDFFNSFQFALAFLGGALLLVLLGVDEIVVRVLFSLIAREA